MDATHVPGCNATHTRRQQCNGPLAEEQRARLIDAIAIVAADLPEPGNSPTADEQRLRQPSGAHARVPKPNTRRLYLILPDTGSRLGIYTVFAIVASVLSWPEWYLGAGFVAFVVAVTEVIGWLTDRVAFGDEVFSIKLRKQQEIYIRYADLQTIEARGQHDVWLRYWAHPEWAAAEHIGRTTLKLGNGPGFAAELERIVSETTIGPPLEVSRRA